MCNTNTLKLHVNYNKMTNKKYPFKLSTANWILTTIISIPVGFIGLITSGAGISSQGISYAFGNVMGVVLPALILALLVWLISGKKEHVGPYTFNILLVLGLLGQLVSFAEQIIN